MLSNTKSPKYYSQFRKKVLNGEMPVCEKIALEMCRIDRLIKDPRFYYDPIPVEGWIDFCENELTLTDGGDLNLLDSFKLWGEEVYGWYYFTKKKVFKKNKNGKGGRYVDKIVKKRLTTKQFLIVGRGNAKTLYSSSHGGYFLVVDKSSTHQIAVAPTMKQGEEILNPLKTAIIRARGPLFSFLTEGSANNTRGYKSIRPKLMSTKKGIENTLTNSLLEVRPMSIDKLQGLQNKWSGIDEWLSCNIREDPIGAIEQGASKLDDYLIIATSSEGTIRNGVGDDIKIELSSILKGDYYAPNVSIWWYCLDDVKEVSNPEMWIKANPNIDITVTYETLQRDIERAENNPSAANDILAKRFDIPTEGYTYYFKYEETIPSERKTNYKNLPCSLGIDLSQGDDFCAFTFLFPFYGYKFGIKTRAYITERTYLKTHSAIREKYKQFIKEGTLVVMDGIVLDMMTVYDDLEEFIEEKKYDVRSVGYDPYNAKEFIQRWVNENGDFAVEVVPQGKKTETVPLGELKKLAENDYLLFDEELMSYSMGNAIVITDTNGNRKILKERQENKIDNVSALIDAYVAYKANMDVFE